MEKEIVLCIFSIVFGIVCILGGSYKVKYFKSKKGIRNFGDRIGVDDIKNKNYKKVTRMMQRDGILVIIGGIIFVIMGIVWFFKI